ncbi:hypothetical protein HYDPIDRAFT_117463 [Hydnomerulius pinastri MD-312]|uniref:glutathione transferase n=1 Tax=Hydnomerulius pinastri MD-312 TaxID=994086 RepID=A0A0C9V492_9AGAM|nr:hypothetical protein HYDPIDRAFT_117463 [Hydnomerulius pinastri MD-312]
MASIFTGRIILLDRHCYLYALDDYRNTMVLKLYGFLPATCTRRAMIVCHGLGVPYELVNVDLRTGAHEDPEYRKKHPFGLVPYIDDDGFILFESRAICRYFVRKYAKEGTKGLLHGDPRQEALFEQAASIEAFNFDPDAVGICMEKIFKPLKGLPTNESRMLEHVDGLSSKMDAYDAMLGNQKYLAGENLTLADLFHVPYIAAVTRQGSVRSSRVDPMWRDE